MEKQEFLNMLNKRLDELEKEIKNDFITKEEYLSKYDEANTGLLNFTILDKIVLKDKSLAKVIKFPKDGMSVTPNVLNDMEEMEKINILFGAGLLLVKIKAE